MSFSTWSDTRQSPTSAKRRHQHDPDNAAIEAEIRRPTDFKPQIELPIFDKAIRPEDFRLYWSMSGSSANALKPA
jgi:hypothetical protein